MNNLVRKKQDLSQSFAQDFSTLRYLDSQGIAIRGKRKNRQIFGNFWN